MSLNKESLPKVLSDAEVLELIIDSIQDIKGKNLLKLDLRKLHDAPTDFFIVCEGDSIVQTKAIANRINYRLKHEANMLPSKIEGAEASIWVLVDYFSIVVHIFHPEARAFYQLEDLWSDAEVTRYEDV